MSHLSRLLEDAQATAKRITADEQQREEETPTERRRRMNKLEADPIAWMRYYLHDEFKGEPAPWHHIFVDKMLHAERMFFVALVSRGLAKSTITMGVHMYLYFVKKEVRYLAMVSKSMAGAEEFLRPYKLAFDKNNLLQRDYGNRRGGLWTDSRFVTSDGVVFAAFSPGHDPRGQKSDTSSRVTHFIIDDLDDKQVCLSPEQLDKRWDFVISDCLPAGTANGIRKVSYLNNPIDEDCLVYRAKALADKGRKNTPNEYFHLTIPLINEDGHSNWPGFISDAEAQNLLIESNVEAHAEYLCNPVRKGDVFQRESIQFKTLPPLHEYPTLLTYHDGGFKDTKHSDMKALVLLGLWKGDIHIRKVYTGKASMRGAVEWHYDLLELLDRERATATWYMEEVFLTSLMYNEFDLAAKEKGFRIPVIGDKRKKPNKDQRINSISGYFSRGKVFWDEAIKDDSHVTDAITQLLKFKVGGKYFKDFPDALEGGIYLLREKARTPKNRYSLLPKLSNPFRPS